MAKRLRQKPGARRRSDQLLAAPAERVPRPGRRTPNGRHRHAGLAGRHAGSAGPKGPDRPGAGRGSLEATARVAPAAAEVAKPRVTAGDLALRQREISVAEFFSKNRHLLGFDNPRRALLMAVKEAVDNSLDACDEAGILPEIRVVLLEKAEDRFRVLVEDNGPGIVKSQIPKIFGKLLYGSKFHTLKQSRGQQGIGISAAGMYGQLTTGLPIAITSRTDQGKPAHYYEVHIDTARNAPEVVKDAVVDWNVKSGTRVEIELEAGYQKGSHSVDEYLRQVAIANPHASISYQPPRGEVVLYRRASETPPPEPRTVRPHPYGVELGALMKMLRASKQRALASFLHAEFSRVSPRIAAEISKTAGLDPRSRPAKLGREDADRLYRAINATKIIAPPSNCLSPVGEQQLLAGLKNVVAADCYVSTTRSPSVYRGNPFLVEAAIAFGGSLPSEEPSGLVRFANRVPLLYQQSACAITSAVIETGWKHYGFQQPSGALPVGPALLAVHVASVWVPFTSESKDAIAHYPEIEKEIRLALQECGRKIGTFIRHREYQAYEAKRRGIFELYIPEVARSLSHLTKAGAKSVQKDLHAIAKKVTKQLELEPPPAPEVETGEAPSPPEGNEKEE